MHVVNYYNVVLTAFGSGYLLTDLRLKGNPPTGLTLVCIAAVPIAKGKASIAAG